MGVFLSFLILNQPLKSNGGSLFKILFNHRNQFDPKKS